MKAQSTSPSTAAAPAARRPYLQPTFLAAVAVLGVAALGLNATTQALQVHFKKQAVPLRAKLDDPSTGVATTLGSWVKATEQVSLNPDLQHELGTDQFVFRQYVNSKDVPADRVAELKGKTEQQQEELLSKISREFPNSVVSFAVTYYTGLADRVTHVPEVCMVAGGYRASDPDVVDDKRAEFTLPDGSIRKVPFRFLNFEDETGRGQVPTRVIYFFNCNGAYQESPQAVRASLQNLFERYGYYAKVELMIRDFHGGRPNPDGTDPGAEPSREAMRDLIAHALPDVERCLPDWAAVKAAAAKK